MSRTDLTPLENALAGLAPSAAGLSRDRVLYEAGRAATSRRPWPMLTAAFAGLAAVLGVQLLQRPAPVTERVEYVIQRPAPAVEPPPAPSEAAGEANWGQAFRPQAGYLSRRDRVLHFGADALPSPIVVPAPTSEPQDLKSLHESIKSS